MPPLQCEGQLFNNLQYTLQYEPKHLPGCRRLWVLNNIVNSTVEKMTLELLLNNGYTMDVSGLGRDTFHPSPPLPLSLPPVPFLFPPSPFSSPLPLSLPPVPFLFTPSSFSSPRPLSLPPFSFLFLFSHLTAPHRASPQDILVFRINYTRLASLPEHAWLDAVTELNEVRNHMIEHGIAHGARWVLPLDGNHFFTAEMWGFILAAASRHEAAGKKNLKIPVAKVDGPQSPLWLNGSTLYRDLQPHAPLQWEGHLGFRNDSPHRFHPGLGYGRRCKLEAMDRICGTGLYYEWHEAFRYLGLLELYHPDFTPLRASFIIPAIPTTPLFSLPPLPPLPSLPPLPLLPHGLPRPPNSILLWLQVWGMGGGAS
ncbi:unnamed protein product [Closterium sp. Naga37s-1]|nr:unnamed protein product [Closterium sp. Naga37s-1]